MYFFDGLYECVALRKTFSTKPMLQKPAVFYLYIGLRIFLVSLSSFFPFQSTLHVLPFCFLHFLHRVLILLESRALL